MFIECPSYFGPIKCFSGCRFSNHTCATSLGLFYKNYGLKGRISHNKFNIPLGLT